MPCGSARGCGVQAPQVTDFHQTRSNPPSPPSVTLSHVVSRGRSPPPPGMARERGLLPPSRPPAPPRALCPPRGPAPGPPLPSRLRGVRTPPPRARRCAPPDLRDSADSSTTHRPARRQIATVPTKAPGGSGMASGSQGGPTALRRPRPPAPPFRTAMTSPGGADAQPTGGGKNSGHSCSIPPSRIKTKREKIPNRSPAAPQGP